MSKNLLMSFDEPCKRLTVKGITRDIIKYLDSGVDLETLKPSEVLSHLAELHECVLSTEEKKSARAIVKEAYDAKQDEDDWKAYKAKFKKPVFSYKPKTRTGSRKSSRSRSKSASPKRKPRRRTKSPSPKRASRSRQEESDIKTMVSESVAPSELESLVGMDKLSELITVASGKATLKDLQSRLSKLGVTRLGGVSIYKIPKTSLVEIILKAAGGVPAPLPIVRPVAVASGPGIVDCNSRANTINSLLDYISSKGWPAPSWKEKKTKAALCAYIATKERQSVPSLLPAVIASPSRPEVISAILKGEEPEDYNNCEKSRKLTIKKIQDWADTRGWSSAEDYPKPNAKKAIWCSWLQKYVNAEKAAIARPRPISPIISPIPVRPSTPVKLLKPLSPVRPAPKACATNPAFDTLEEFETDYTCPPGNYCNVDSKVCSATPGTGMEKVEIPLSGGRSVTVFGHPKNLTALKERVAGKLPPRSPVPIPVAPTAPKKKKPKVGAGLGFITENLEEQAKNQALLEQIMGGVPQAAPEALVASEMKVAREIEDLKALELVERRKAQALAETIAIEEREKRAIEAAIVQAPKPVIVEEREPSEVTRLISRLRDIQAIPQSTPVRLIGAQNSLADKIALCTGISQ